MAKKKKPTEKQRSTFEHIKKGMNLRDAMLAGGYSPQTSQSPKQNFMDGKGTQTLIDKYKDMLIEAGIDLPILVEIQAEGLFDQNSAIRLMYLKETKKDFGLAVSESGPPINAPGAKILVIPSEGLAEKYGIQISHDPGDSSPGQNQV